MHNSIGNQIVESPSPFPQVGTIHDHYNQQFQQSLGRFTVYFEGHFCPFFSNLVIINIPCYCNILFGDIQRSYCVLIPRSTRCYVLSRHVLSRTYYCSARCAVLRHFGAPGGLGRTSGQVVRLGQVSVIPIAREVTLGLTETL